MATHNGSLVLLDEHGATFALRFVGELTPAPIREAIEAFSSMVLGDPESFAVFTSEHSDAGLARTDSLLVWIGIYTPEHGFHSYMQDGVGA